MKKKIFLFIFSVFLLTLVSSFGMDLKPMNTNGELSYGIPFNYVFNFSNDSQCNNVITSYKGTFITGNDGIAFADINVNNNFDLIPKYMCEYRGGNLRAIHRLPEAILDEIYSQNSNLEKDYSGLNVNNSDYLDGFDSNYFYPNSNPSNFYNSDDFDIDDYLTKTKILGFNYYNLSNFNINDYYLKSNPLNFLNQTNINSLYLSLDGSNANQNIDIGSYDFLTSGDISANWFKGKFNWTTDDWHSFNGYNLTFNESKLSSIYYSPTQSEIIRGTLDGGNITLIQHPDRHYDDITLNISEVSGSPGLDVRINITNVDDFNRGVLRYKTSSLSGDYPIRQLWNYDTSTWEDYPPIGEITTFLIVTEPIFDSSSHLRNGTVQMRIYKASNGNTNNHYYIDWFALVKGYGTPAGQEADPYSFHTDKNLDNTGFNITASTGFFEFLGSLTNKIAKIFTTDIEISGKINLTNGTYNSQIYLDENGTTNIIGQNGVFKIY